jgi:hypothetical protein
MDYQKFFDTGKMLFEHFGWYSIFLVLGTTLLMIPVNMLYKKIMKKDGLERLRKTVSCLSVYLIALGLVAFFTGVVLKHELTFSYLFSGSMSCGLLSMFLWAVIKFVRDYGVLPVVKKVLETKQAKAWIKELGISENLISLIVKDVDKYVKENNIVSLNDYIAKEMNIANQIRTQLNGFVANDKVNEIVKNILQPIKAKLK